MRSELPKKYLDLLKKELIFSEAEDHYKKFTYFMMRANSDFIHGKKKREEIYEELRKFEWNFREYIHELSPGFVYASGGFDIYWKKLLEEKMTIS